MTLFGRLDIVFPDGQRETRQLRGDSITVGSAPSCAIRLSRKVAVDRLFRLDYRDDSVFITNLASHGARVDGKQIAPNSPAPLDDTSRFTAGSLQFTFYRHRDSPTIAMSAPADQTQPIATGIRASLDQPRITVFPASSVTISLNIANTGKSDAEFRVEVSGPPGDWVKPERLTFPLPAQEDTQLRFLIKPELRADIAPQSLPLIIDITRIGESQRQLRLTGQLNLGGFGGLSLALDPPICLDNGDFALFLLNQGNEPLHLTLESHDPESRLNLTLNRASVTLPPGRRAQIGGRARSRKRPLVGKARVRPFVLTAKADNPAGYTVPLPAAIRVTPLISSRAAKLLAALIIASAILAALLLLQPPAPQIDRFSVAQSQVAQGTPAQLSWSAENAHRFVIEVDRVPVAALPADASSYALDTRPYSDPIDIALIAQQGDIAAIESYRLDIYEPAAIARFYADRAAMLRRIVGTLVVRWEVDGAVAIDVARPLGFETISESHDDSRGELVLRGAPQAPFELRLSATDEMGNTTIATIQIAIRDPECSPRRDASLYAGPDARYQPVKVAIANVPVLIRGTNAARNWLQVELANGMVGWADASYFHCQGFTPAALEVVSDIPPPPTDTPTPTPAATKSDSPRPSATPGSTPPPIASPFPTALAP